jgi:hypothetical protein
METRPRNVPARPQRSPSIKSASAAPCSTRFALTSTSKCRVCPLRAKSSRASDWASPHRLSRREWKPSASDSANGSPRTIHVWCAMPTREAARRRARALQARRGGRDVELQPGAAIRVRSSEDLVIYKLISTRLRDHEDAQGIARRQRDNHSCGRSKLRSATLSEQLQLSGGHTQLAAEKLSARSHARQAQVTFALQRVSI